ncbi:MAG: hypothetical protein A2096_11330 [Spirochaetes bacterium GWF1_41_5]|nr:MAG: hypothetical protein A2096_11330 [Spirochaetes bacterium GWF1_41_5]
MKIPILNFKNAAAENRFIDDSDCRFETMTGCPNGPRCEEFAKRKPEAYYLYVEDSIFAGDEADGFISTS